MRCWLRLAMSNGGDKFQARHADATSTWVEREAASQSLAPPLPRMREGDQGRSIRALSAQLVVKSQPIVCILRGK